jgi:hypothetical protein
VPYSPHPIWFATNHNAMIETGTPSNHATPYFIVVSPSVNSLRGRLQHAFQTVIADPVSPLLWTTVEVVMRAFNHNIESVSMALVTESVDITTTLKQMMSRLRRKARHVLCTVLNGGHELYRARTDTKLYQECLLCGYQTNGWTIDRRDRRLHLVANNSQPTAATRR